MLDHAAMLRVIDLGLGATVQDRGRPGWRRFGVPIGGWMDAHAAECANRLLDNPLDAPVIEMLLQGAVFEVLNDVWISVCGADVYSTVPLWRAHQARAGEVLRFSQNRSGMWIYLAIEGGFDWPPVFGSASYYSRAHLGSPLEKGTLLRRLPRPPLTFPKGVSGRMAGWKEQRTYSSVPLISLWPGPQLEFFSKPAITALVEQEWHISPQSDRVGYRLRGPKLAANPDEIVSEPVRTGSIQVPQNGQLIVTMPDGPTVGGYPKIALVQEEALSWLAQCRPGQALRFTWLK